MEVVGQYQHIFNKQSKLCIIFPVWVFLFTSFELVILAPAAFRNGAGTVGRTRVRYSQNMQAREKRKKTSCGVF